jgi:hypothetical protein
MKQLQFWSPYSATAVNVEEFELDMYMQRRAGVAELHVYVFSLIMKRCGGMVIARGSKFNSYPKQ